MKRIQSFEFNDQTWLPQIIRNSIVETLGHGLEAAGVYENVAPVFADFCRRARCRSILDLCSGSGEPVSILVRAMERSGEKLPRIVMSDLFPDTAALSSVCSRHQGVVDMIPTPVDAANVDKELDCQAVMVNNAFHHFPPQLASRILADAVAKGRAVFIVEGLSGRLIKDLPFFFKLLQTGALRAFRNGGTAREKIVRLLVAAGPLLPMGGWDGMISSLRIHRKQDLMDMALPLGSGYSWEYREVPFYAGCRALVFMGMPGNSF